MFCAAAAAEERRDTEGEEVLSYVWNISAGDHGQKALKLHTAVEVEFSWVSFLHWEQGVLDFTLNLLRTMRKKTYCMRIFQTFVKERTAILNIIVFGFFFAHFFPFWLDQKNGWTIEEGSVKQNPRKTPEHWRHGGNLQRKVTVKTTFWDRGLN